MKLFLYGFESIEISAFSLDLFIKCVNSFLTQNKYNKDT